MKLAPIALISIYQCAHAMEEPLSPWTWTPGERTAYLYPNLVVGGLFLWAAIWAYQRWINDLPIVESLEEPESELRTELRRHRRYGDHR